MDRTPCLPRRLRPWLAAGAACGALLAGPAAAQSAPDALDEIVVTGSRLSGARRLAPAETLTREDLEASGVTEASGLPGLLTANSGSEARIDQMNQPQSSGTAQFNLRNLGLGATLVLVDGQRWTTSAVVSPDGSAFVDINALVPLIALERIEAVRDGASAVYGSDAVAGVVNFITRRRVDRPELRLTHAAMDGAAETTVEAVGGLALGGGDLVLAAGYFHRSALGSDERGFTQAETHGRAAWSAVTSYGQPGAFHRPSTGGFSPDPDCGHPAFTRAFRTGPGDAFCRLDYSDFFDLAPEETRTQAFADWRATRGGVEVWLQGSGSLNHTRARQSPSLPILARSLVTPAAHPDNPFGEDVLFRGRLLGAEAGASAADFNYRTWRLAGGLSGVLGGGWTWSVTATSSRQHVAYDKPDVIGTALQNALYGLGGPGCDPAAGAPGVGPCQWFNPFGSAWLGTGTANSPALIASLTGSTGLRGAAGLETLDAHAEGRVMDGAAGVLDVAVGAQHRRSRFRHDWSDLVNAGELLTAGYSPDFSGRGSALAVFAEARWRPAGGLEVQAAARHESYDGGQDAFSPKLAVRWDAGEALTLRASWGRGFRAPSVFALSGAQAAQPSVFDRGAYVFVNTLISGDADLRPETSESLNLGALWRPLEGLELTLDAWRFDYEDMVVKESAQAIIDQAAADDAAGLTGTPAQGRVTRAPGGALSLVRLHFINASSVEARGLDLSVRHGRDLTILGRAGRLSLTAVWTHVDRHDIRMAPGGPVVQGAGSTNLNTLARSLPRDRARLSLSWRDGGQGATATLHHTGGYRNDRSGITDSSIASQSTLDLHYVRTLGGEDGDLELALGVVNVADRDPPLAQFTLGYDPMTADPRGRVFTLGLTRRF